MGTLDLYPANLRSQADLQIKEALKHKGGLLSLTFVRITGDQLDVETRVYPGFWDGNESIYYISWDISELRESEKQLRRSEERLHLALAANNRSVWNGIPGKNYSIWIPTFTPLRDMNRMSFQRQSKKLEKGSIRRFGHPAGVQ